MNAKILIVDDSLTVRMDLDEAFQAAGFTTALCATVAAAREALHGESFALIVLDVLLPDADGIDFLKEIRDNPASAGIPVMLLSSEAEVRDRVRGIKTGAEEYIGKPYDTSYVIGRARELVRRSGKAPAAAGPAILVIDDSLTFREELKSALQTAGYSVATAGTGEEGLRMAADLRPAALIVDRMLPGIDGGTVVRRIRLDVALRRTPCLLLTASDEQGEEVKLLDAGVDAYVRKGGDIGIVLTRLAAMLRSSRANSAPTPAASLLSPKKILTVDDSQTYLQEIASQLRDEGYDAVLAHSGEEAIELLAVQSVDCILLDLIMPGLSGEDTCKKIKSSTGWRDIPLIILTAMQERDAMIAGINAGADDYIPKSGDFEVLKARLRAQLRRKQFEDESRQIREELLQNQIEASEARAARELAETRAVLLADLAQKNEELESFSYSVSHDLRAPLRTMEGFARIIIDEHGATLDPAVLEHLERICTAGKRMGQLIADLLNLARVSRREMKRERVNLSQIAREVAADLARSAPDRCVEFTVADGLKADGDASLLRLILENLLGNAWKYSGKIPDARIEMNAITKDGRQAFFVRDNGAGFEMKYASKLFAPFQRFHDASEFPGTGIGLATVKRVIGRHGGRIWAESAPGKGSTFFFTLGDAFANLPGPAAN